MMRSILSSFFFISIITGSYGQSLCDGDGFRVLHFTKTTGFDHQTRSESKNMFTAIGNARGFTIDDQPGTEKFDHIDSLRNYAVVIFSNTSSKNSAPALNATQQQNFETYINEGGSFIGLHKNGNRLPDGTYFYIAKFDASTYKGWIEISR